MSALKVGRPKGNFPHGIYDKDFIQKLSRFSKRKISFAEWYVFIYICVGFCLCLLQPKKILEYSKGSTDF